MISETLVDLSRLQFAATAMYHFLFVPLTLGMVWILVIMESTYVMTGKPVYREMTKFWGKLFGINFAMGVMTGITLEFQFGTNWAYYSHYVGDIFGAPLAIEGLMAFFLESTFVGLFFFGWERLSRLQHLLVTILVAVGSNLSAVWILVANGWMQDPVGATFNYETMRMELSDFWAVVFNPTAQAKFVHTVGAGYVTGSLFVLAISSWYLLHGRHLELAKRSFRIASAFGLASAACVIVLGDESGYSVTESQRTKLAAMEAIWDTEKPPAGLTLFAIPDEKARVNRYEVKLPYLLGLIGTRSASKAIPGIKEISEGNRERIVSGIQAVTALERLRGDPRDEALRATFERHKADLGYGLLLRKYTDDVRNATPGMIATAAASTIPRVWPLFWAFRVMVAFAFIMLALFAWAFYATLRGRCGENRTLLRLTLWLLPMPWVAAELGWFVAEYGRQPWTIFGVLPTHLSTSTLSVASLYGSLAGFVALYTAMLLVELYLMFKYARRGPTEPVPRPAGGAQGLHPLPAARAGEGS